MNSPRRHTHRHTHTCTTPLSRKKRRGKQSSYPRSWGCWKGAVGWRGTGPTRSRLTFQQPPSAPTVGSPFPRLALFRVSRRPPKTPNRRDSLQRAEGIRSRGSQVAMLLSGPPSSARGAGRRGALARSNQPPSLPGLEHPGIRPCQHIQLFPRPPRPAIVMPTQRDARASPTWSGSAARALARRWVRIPAPPPSARCSVSSVPPFIPCPPSSRDARPHGGGEWAAAAEQHKDSGRQGSAPSAPTRLAAPPTANPSPVQRPALRPLHAQTGEKGVRVILGSWL